jgi:exoribonuclease-2
VLDGGQVQATPVHASGPARQLVSEMMVSTCAAVGAWCHDQQVPCVYRAQPDPDVSPGVEGTEVTDTIEQLRVLRRLKPSGLTTRPQRHYTLGISGYTQVTSPIRRYMDLVMHRQIKSALRRRRPPCGEGDLQGLFDTVERTSGAIRRAAMESRRFWILRLLEQQPDTRWRALALRSLGRRWLVELQDLAFSAAITDGAPFQEGEELTLEVADVDARRDHLQLKVVERSRP